MLTNEELTRWRAENARLTWSPFTEGPGSGPRRVEALICEVFMLRDVLAGKIASCPISESVAASIMSRAALGLQKYGVTMDRACLSRADWLRHAQEEAMDLAVYLERCIREVLPHDA